MPLGKHVICFYWMGQQWNLKPRVILIVSLSIKKPSQWDMLFLIKIPNEMYKGPKWTPNTNLFTADWSLLLLTNVQKEH